MQFCRGKNLENRGLFPLQLVFRLGHVGFLSGSGSSRSEQSGAGRAQLKPGIRRVKSEMYPPQSSPAGLLAACYHGRYDLNCRESTVILNGRKQSDNY